MRIISSIFSITIYLPTTTTTRETDKKLIHSQFDSMNFTFLLATKIRYTLWCLYCRVLFSTHTTTYGTYHYSQYSYTKVALPFVYSVPSLSINTNEMYLKSDCNRAKGCIWGWGKSVLYCLLIVVVVLFNINACNGSFSTSCSSSSLSRSISFVSFMQLSDGLMHLEKKIINLVLTYPIKTQNIHRNVYTN